MTRHRGRAGLRGLALVLLTFALSAPGAVFGVEPPELRFQPSPEENALAARLADLDPELLVRMMTLFGLEEPGPPIRVVLAREDSPEARRAPSWSVGYAIGEIGLVVLLPSRVPAYPDGSLEGVLVHEIAHVLIARATERRSIPRWFNEGMALYAARGFRLADRSRVLLGTLRRGSLSLGELDQGFYDGPQSAAHAYALSGALVRLLLLDQGEEAASRILSYRAEGRSFPEAFQFATGLTLAKAETKYLKRMRLWNFWLPLVGSSTTLWVAISLLALVAFRRRRVRDAEILERWREEEAELEATRLKAADPGEWIH